MTSEQKQPTESPPGYWDVNKGTEYVQPPAGGAPGYPTTGYTQQTTTVYPVPAPNQPVGVQPTNATTIIVRGGTCPRCMQGILVEDFTCLGICLGIFFFPLGLICCLLLRGQRCNTCGYRVG